MNILQIALIVLVVVLVVGKRLAGRPVDTRRSVLMPAVLAVYGVVILQKAGTVTHTDQVWLAGSGLVSIAFGLVRGMTVRLYERNGYLWAKYRPSTLVLWAASIAARFAIEAAAVASGAGRGVMTSSLMLMFGLSLAAESLIVVPRALASSVPVMARS